jgi:hypothetical protein
LPLEARGEWVNPYRGFVAPEETAQGILVQRTAA